MMTSMEMDQEEEISEVEQEQEEEEREMDTDEELQEAFAAGIIKPGLNTVGVTKAPRKMINDVAGLKQKLQEFVKSGTLPWLERLDLVTAKAKMAPELAYKEDQHRKEREKATAKDKTSLANDPVHNDFQREMIFYRQAQAATMEGIARLKAMGLPTKRPEDYFAQMAKSDEHMQKIRKKLVSKQATEEKMEKIKKLRELRKFGKKVQVEVQQKRHKEKREMLEQVKKFRKGQTDSLDFLDEKGPQKRRQKPGQGPNSSGVAKRNFKDKKFGFGGKKRGGKANTKDSVNDVSSFRPGNKAKGSKKGGSVGNKKQRPGKSRRKQMKSKGKKR